MGSRDLEGGRIRAACRIFGTGCVGITGRYESCGGVLATEPSPQTLSGPQRCTFFRKGNLSRNHLGRNRVFSRESYRVINPSMPVKLAQSHARKLITSGKKSQSPEAKR